MAGRPKMKAQRVAGCEAAAAQLAADVFALCPVRYLTVLALPGRDATARRWKCAVDAMLDAAVELKALGDRLRLRAGIEGPSPLAELVQSADAEGSAPHLRKHIRARTAPSIRVDTIGDYGPEYFVGT